MDATLNRKIMDALTVKFQKSSSQKFQAGSFTLKFIDNKEVTRD